MAEGARQRWRYEPDEDPKRKHGWHKDEAGFVEQDGVLVGKCPKGMTNAEAEDLLNAGIPLIDEDDEGPPQRIFAIRNGVLYRAVPGNPGSYHGFPELPERFWELPKKFRDSLFEHARNLGMERALKKWLQRQWPSKQ